MSHLDDLATYQQQIIDDKDRVIGLRAELKAAEDELKHSELARTEIKVQLQGSTVRILTGQLTDQEATIHELRLEGHWIATVLTKIDGESVYMSYPITALELIKLGHDISLDAEIDRLSHVEPAKPGYPLSDPLGFVRDQPPYQEIAETRKRLKKTIPFS